TRASDGAAALWKFNMQRVQRGVVCKLNSAGWTVKGVGDFNGDANQDIIWRNSDGRTAIWLLRGSTRVSGGFSNNQTGAWYLEATKDFDGDGKADILWRNQSTDQVMMWFMDGATVKTSMQVGLIEDKWKLLGVGDFNGDRKGDLLWKDTTTDRLRMWLMNGATLTSNIAPSQEIVTGYTFLGIGDYDGDGKSDILWKNAANALITWKMDSGTRVETVLAAVDASWTFESSMDADLDYKSDWIWSIPNPNLSLPTLGITRVVAVPQGTATYNPVRPGWTSFKYDHF
ncbi:MAG: VCBS repeat-containing protein, partial [Bdellovibrionota bacterium]